MRGDVFCLPRVFIALGALCRSVILAKDVVFALSWLGLPTENHAEYLEAINKLRDGECAEPEEKEAVEGGEETEEVPDVFRLESKVTTMYHLYLVILYQ